ncbi:MAG TPA: DUF4129 domain-containing protein [Micromonosporaceae bacterium]|jgi:hypothetical protein
MDALTRAWDEWVADLSETVGLSVPTLIFLSIIAALLVGVAWYFWPAWLPWNWNLAGGREARRARRDRRARSGRRRLGRLRWRLRWRRRPRGTEEPQTPTLPDDEVPDLPAEVLTLTADQLAAAGRYAEAVRERLRAMLRGLIERDLLPSSPGWTVMELAAVGARVRPALSSPLGAAAGIFSEIWYGLRPATVADDAAMRTHAAAVAEIAAQSPASVTG